MSEDVYYRLGERLNENQVKLPLVDPFLEILREYYTEEQAAVGADFPLGSHKPGSPANRWPSFKFPSRNKAVPAAGTVWNDVP